MDYLIQQFHNYLKEEGDVDIAEYLCRRNNILKELEQEGYTESFNEWLQQQRQMDNLIRANEILSLHDNRTHSQRLTEGVNQ